MSAWANNFAPNLFTTFADWHDNYVENLGREPSEDALELAREYFQEETLWT